MCLAVVLFLVLWNSSQNYNNFLGVVIVTLALMIFYFTTPLFIRFVPLKRYTRHHEENEHQDFDIADTENFHFNRDAFDRVKKSRAANQPVDTEDKADRIIEEINSEQYVPIIKDVSSSHVSSDAPLKKVQKQPQRTETEPPANEDNEDDVRAYVPKQKRPDGTRYTANRKL